MASIMIWNFVKLHPCITCNYSSYFLFTNQLNVELLELIAKLTRHVLEEELQHFSHQSRHQLRMLFRLSPKKAIPKCITSWSTNKASTFGKKLKLKFSSLSDDNDELDRSTKSLCSCQQIKY